MKVVIVILILKHVIILIERDFAVLPKDILCLEKSFNGKQQILGSGQIGEESGKIAESITSLTTTKYAHHNLTLL